MIIFIVGFKVVRLLLGLFYIFLWPSLSAVDARGDQLIADYDDGNGGIRMFRQCSSKTYRCEELLRALRHIGKLSCCEIF